MKQGKTIQTEVAQYICSFTPTESGYSVRCAEFPGLITNGRTLDQARRNAREALELCLEVYRDKGWKLPKTAMVPKRKVQELISVALPEQY